MLRGLSDGEELFVVDATCTSTSGMPRRPTQRNIHGQAVHRLLLLPTTARLQPRAGTLAQGEIRKVERRRTQWFATSSSTGRWTWRSSSRPTSGGVRISRASTPPSRTPPSCRRTRIASSSTSSFDPREGTAALEHLHALKEAYGIRGVKRLHGGMARTPRAAGGSTTPTPTAASSSARSWASPTSTSTRGRPSRPLVKDAFDCHDVD